MSTKVPYPTELTELYRELIDTVVAKQFAYREKELVLFGVFIRRDTPTALWL